MHFSKIVSLAWINQHAWPRPWPAFNLADGAIVVGAALFVYEILFTKSPTAENSA